MRDWEEGRARARGAAVEFIVPSVAYRAKLADVLGYSVDERRIVGVAADRRDDNTILGLGHSGVLRAGGNTPLAAAWAGWNTTLKPAVEHWIIARKPLEGTIVDNVTKWGTGAINVDGCRVATTDTLNGDAAGRWPAHLVLDETIGALLDVQSGAAGAAAPVRGTEPSASTDVTFG